MIVNTVLSVLFDFRWVGYDYENAEATEETQEEWNEWDAMQVSSLSLRTVLIFISRRIG